MLDRSEPVRGPALLLDVLLSLGAQDRSAIARAAGESVREFIARNG